MWQLIEANWVAFLIVAVLAVLIALWLVARGRRPRTRSHRPDVLDEGVAPARRNQALIDAPADAPEPPATPDGMGGAGTAVAAAVLANEPGNDGETAIEPRAEPPPVEVGIHESDTQAISDREAVAAAVKLHEGDSATDDLSRIKGIGPKLVGMLGSMGISRYDQIAAWSDDDVQRIDAQMGAFQGRIARDDWREQARHLSAGDKEAYEAKFGKL